MQIITQLTSDGHFIFSDDDTQHEARVVNLQRKLKEQRSNLCMNFGKCCCFEHIYIF